MHLLIIRRLVALSALALVFAACGGDDSSSSANDSTTTTAGQTTTSASSSADATLAVADGHLVGPGGMSVYLFDKDQGTTSACMEQCAQAWPAVVASGAPTAGDGVDASKLSTAKGQVADQVVYNGHLLYTFSGDKAPGDTNGKGIPSWYLVGADGEEIEAG